MENVVGVKMNDDGKFEETMADKISFSCSTPHLGADPLVYKLVRVDGDGRLVPATDDEIMEVENFLAVDDVEMHLVSDTVQSICDERSSSGMSQLASSEGLLQSGSTEAAVGKTAAHLQDYAPLSILSLNEIHTNNFGSVGECLNSPNELIEGQSSASDVCNRAQPDFSKLNGEICLDNLSIKELHETFKATFGRDTTVKDKQWLKRRIAMGLTKSCNIPTSAFIIKDNKLVNKDEGESFENKGSTVIEDLASNAANESCKDPLLDHDNKMEDLPIVSGGRVRNQSIEYDSGSGDFQTEQRPGKRVRKPTRRYIEELSEGDSKEHCGRSKSSVKRTELQQICPASYTRPINIASSNRKAAVTRLDSLGGSGVQVPYVSRARRSRPRKNIMALMEFNPLGMGGSATLAKQTLCVDSYQPNNDDENGISIAKAAPEQSHLPITELEKDERSSEMSLIEKHRSIEPKHVDGSGGETSDDNIVTVPTVKGGMRRKHHRAWTLSEVMKLVEGVSRYGAGKWSEIKRLSFASYSYRTSVDLKDKWRNLLKASLAQTPPDKLSSRKHASSVPIPAPILLRVRELAEMQTQAAPSHGSCNLALPAGGNVPVTRSGYL